MIPMTQLKLFGERTSRGRRVGSATVEMAIILPILLTLGFITCDFGRFAYYHIAVTNAVRAGAAYGAMHPVSDATKDAWDAAITAAVRSEMSANTSWYEEDHLAVGVPTVEDDGGLGLRRVTVSATYSFQTIVPWPFLPGYSDAKSLRRTVAMRMIR